MEDPNWLVHTQLESEDSRDHRDGACLAAPDMVCHPALRSMPLCGGVEKQAPDHVNKVDECRASSWSRWGGGEAVADALGGTSGMKRKSIPAKTHRRRRRMRGGGGLPSLFGLAPVGECGLSRVSAADCDLAGSPMSLLPCSLFPSSRHLRPFSHAPLTTSRPNPSAEPSDVRHVAPSVNRHPRCNPRRPCRHEDQAKPERPPIKPPIGSRKP